MNEPHQFPDTETEEQASLWAARLEGRSLEAGERAELEAWLSGDPARRAALSAFCRLSSRLDRAVSELLASGSIEVRYKEEAPGRAKVAAWGIATAAMAAVAVAAAIWMFGFAGRAETLSTPSGQRQAFTLSDGASYAIYWDNVTNSTADPGVPPTGYAECIDGPKCSYSTISNTTQALVATYNSVPVPEPASAALLLAGIGGLTLRHKRMKVFASFFKKKRFLF